MDRLLSVTSSIWVIHVNLCQPSFEQKQHGLVGGIPALKAIWDWLDLSLLFSQSGIRKHAGVPAWTLSFAYVCGLMARATSTNKIAEYVSGSPLFRCLLPTSMTQCSLSRFLSTSYDWLSFSLGRLSRLQEKPECRLEDGDVVALDDTKLEHPYGKLIPFLCWLFDYSDKRHVWCMNIVSTLAVRQNGLEYPLLWRFWTKSHQDSDAPSKIDLAKQMLKDIRSLTSARLFVTMDRWFLCKRFLVWLTAQGFDWVTKAKRNTVLFRRMYDPALGKEVYTKVNPSLLLREIYPMLRLRKKGQSMGLPAIYMKLPYEMTTRKGKSITRQRYVPIAAVAATMSHSTSADVLMPMVKEEAVATYQDAYLLLSNRVDTPDIAAEVYGRRWRIEVFYRAAKQDLGLTACTARSKMAHFAHVELVFTAMTLLSIALWREKKEGVVQAPTLSEMARCFFNASYRICCCNQQIHVYFDTVTERFASLIESFWPTSFDCKLWDWNSLPESA